MFDTCILASNIKNATVQYLHEMNKLKSEKVTLKLQHLGNNYDLSLVIFSDALFGNIPDRNTQGEVLIALMRKTGKVCPLKSRKKIRRVVRSTVFSLP